MKEQVRTEIARILEEWFNDPIDVPCAYCEAAKEIEQQLQQHEAQALKEQMERVIGMIDEHREFHKGALREGGEYYELHRAVISALNNLKAELEGE